MQILRNFWFKTIYDLFQRRMILEWKGRKMSFSRYKIPSATSSSFISLIFPKWPRNSSNFLLGPSDLWDYEYFSVPLPFSILIKKFYVLMNSWFSLSGLKWAINYSNVSPKVILNFYFEATSFRKGWKFVILCGMALKVLYIINILSRIF